MVRARPSVVVTEPGGHQALVLPSHTSSMGTPGSLSIAVSTSNTSARTTMSLATAGSVLHPSYLGLDGQAAFSGGWRGALLLLFSSATACSLLGFPPQPLCLIDSMLYKIGKDPFISDHIYYIEAPPR